VEDNRRRLQLQVKHYRLLGTQHRPRRILNWICYKSAESAECGAASVEGGATRFVSVCLKYAMS